MMTMMINNVVWFSCMLYQRADNDMSLFPFSSLSHGVVHIVTGSPSVNDCSIRGG